MAKFTLYWLDGSRNVITGDTVEDAFSKAGYGAAAIHAVDWYENGENNDYVWNADAKRWDRKEPLPIAVEIANSQKGVDGAKGLYNLYISRNLGADYNFAYGTNDKEDPELKRRIKEAEAKVLRYHVEGNDDVMCPQHKAVLGLGSFKNHKRSIEEQAEILRKKFCK